MIRTAGVFATVLLACALLVVMSGSGMADQKRGGDYREDYQQAYQRQQDKQILPLEEIIEKIRLEETDRILEVEYEREHGRDIYEIEYLDSAGDIYELEVDAHDGSIMRRGRD
jgi:uncharacterized membrane protein YkoI